MKFANKIFGAQLRVFREEAGLKQKDLAGALEVEVPTVSRWETGDFMPEDEKFEKICKVLKKPPHRFFTATKPGALDPQDLGRAVQALTEAGPTMQAFVLYLLLGDQRSLDKVSATHRQWLLKLSE